MAPARGLRGALRNLWLKGLSLGLERACRFVVVVAAAPVLGQAAFGRFVFASTVTALLALGTDLGLGLWTTRALARSRGEGEPRGGAGANTPESANARIIRVGLSIRALAALPYGCAVAVVAVFAARGEARAAMGLLGLAALVNAFVDHFGAILRGYERFADEARLNTSRAVLLAAAGLATLATPTVARSLVGLCAGFAAANLGSGIYGVFILRRLHPSSREAPRIERAIRAPLDRAFARIALGQALPLWFAGLFSMLYFKVDTLFLRSMAGDAELGAYAAAFKIFEGVMILPSILLSVTFPQLARAHANPPVQRRLEQRLGALLLGMGLLIGAMCLVGAPALVRAFFFARSLPSLRILAAGIPLLFLNYGLTHFLVARDLGRMAQWFAVTMLAVNVILDVVLIPRAGGPGAAWATVVTEIALTACCLRGLRMTTSSARTLPSAPAASRTGKKAA
jgi:O-antigen/teichoic acid export membrane protein